MAHYKQDKIEKITPESVGMVSANPYGASGGYSDNPYNKKGGFKARYVIIPLLLLIIAAFGVCGYMLYGSAMSVKADASTLMSDISTLKKQIKAADMEDASATATRIAQTAATMHEQTDTPLWNIASAIPVVGSDIRSVQVLAEAADRLGAEALVPLTSTLKDTPLSSMMSDGAINVEVVSNLVNQMNAVAPVVSEAAKAVSDLPEPHIDQIKNPLNKAKNQLTSLDDYMQVAAKLSAGLPTLLGANGQTQNYLVVALSNAEIRAAGGFPGSWGMLSVTDGHLSLGEFSSIQWALPEEHSNVPLTDEEMLMFGEGMGELPGNSTVTPHFPRAAEIMRFWWQYVTGTDVSGVIAVDPVYLQTILGVVGAVETDWGITVDGSNAAALLLHDSYNWIDTDYQDGFFALVAGEAFNRLTHGLGDIGIKGLINLIKNARETHHMQIWFADPSSQEAMELFGISGAIEEDPTEPVVGVYVNDDTWAKISWYLNLHTTIGEGVKNEDGTTTYPVTTTITNTMTRDEVWHQSNYVIGYSPSRRYDGDMITSLVIVAPAGGRIAITGVDTPLNVGAREGSLNGHQAWTDRFNNGPGETTTVTYNVIVSPDATEPLQVRQTPLGQSFGE